MKRDGNHKPEPAFGAEIKKDGDKWALVLVRELAHAPEKVWTALTDPEHLRAWAPFDSDRNLGAVGTATLTTVGAASLHITESRITRADAPRALEFTWGDQEIRWQLEPSSSGGTRLTIWHSIDRRFIAMGAAGWHLCIDVMDSALRGRPIGRTVGPDAMRLEGWQQLLGEYAALLGAPPPAWPADPA